MNGICRLGDMITPHCGPHPTETASDFVRVDRKQACRRGDLIKTHFIPPGDPTCGETTHQPSIQPDSTRFARFDKRHAAAGNDQVDDGCNPIDATSVSTFFRTS